MSSPPDRTPLILGSVAAIAVAPSAFAAEALALAGHSWGIALVPLTAAVAFVCGLFVRRRLIKVALFLPAAALVILFGPVFF